MQPRRGKCSGACRTVLLWGEPACKAEENDGWQKKQEGKGRRIVKGLELSEKYYREYGERMIREQFPEIAGQAAAGLVGYGSECLGFDDEISRDHDYGPSFCVWLPREIYRQYGEKLQTAYNALPKAFMGFGGRVEEEQGKGRVGALCLEDFYLEILGRESAPETAQEWFMIPEPSLCAAVGGQVFEDFLGRFTEIRNALLAYYPEEVWRKKLAESLARAAQAGQYNYARAMKRGERIAAEIALTEFVKEAMQIVYLLNKKYAPFYKWMHRGLRDLSVCGEIGDMLSLLYQVPDPAAAWEGAGPADFLYQLNTGDGRVVVIEAVCNVLVQTLNEMGLSRVQDNFLQMHVGEVL
ncbi:MAG: DUF4037 domain-containing protein [Lachnospiraceae bacterium]|nr:DUF4037 domain-containing protein [Lachnospiraceae bacterium]